MSRKISAGIHEIQSGAVNLSFTLWYSRRKLLTIRVHPDQTITVDAPTGTPLSWVREVVLKKAAWIHRKQGELSERTPRTRQYVSGEAYRYLGRLIYLNIEAGTPTQTTLSGEILTVIVPTPNDPARVEAVVRDWFMRQAKRVFDERMAVCLPLAAALGIPAPQKFTIRLMKTRWGSCSGSGRVTLNLRLVQVDTAFIDYVLLHELCHLRELNHSKRFYALMTSILPDWRDKRHQLNRCETLW